MRVCRCAGVQVCEGKLSYCVKCAGVKVRVCAGVNECTGVCVS